MPDPAPFQAGALLRWYRRHRRDMPWRGHPSPYAVWVSEIMLQQTQVDTVRPYFTRFLARFPDVPALAAADTGAVLKQWEGLGYYARARHLQAAARQLVRDRDGRLPRRAVELAALPGIGPYTAAAIASICFGERVPVVDGNVARVFARLLGWDDDFTRPAARRRLAARLQPALDAAAAPGDLNQAMMELGALVCRPRQPACAACPLAAACTARRAGTQHELPARRRRPARPVRHAVAAVIRRAGRVLLVRRAEAGLLGGLWELPGGPLAADAAGDAELDARVHAATGLRAADAVQIGTIRQAFTHFDLALHVVACRGRGRLRRGLPARWVDAPGLRALPLSAAQRRALQLAGLTPASTAP